MTDDERGKSKDATEESAPDASPSPPTPPPPDVSMFDEALQPLDIPDMVGETGLAERDRAASEPDVEPPSDEAPVSSESPEQLGVSDAIEREEPGRDGSPDASTEPGEPSSVRRARITLKIPDDAVPLSSPQPPSVQESAPDSREDKMLSPAAVVQAMRIISIGESAPVARDEAPIEQLEPEDQLDEADTLGAGDLASPLPDSSLTSDDVAAGGDELRSEEVEPVPSEPSSQKAAAQDVEDEEELEPDDEDEAQVPLPPPVAVSGREESGESPPAPRVVPLSPSASAPPPPTRAATRSAPDIAPVPLPKLDVGDAQPPASPGEPSAVELDDDEIAPASTKPSGGGEQRKAPVVPPPPPPPATADATPVPTPAPAPVTSRITRDLEDTPPEGTPPPPPVRPPKAPPPPKKKRPKSDLEKRERRARPGWEEVFADEFVRAFPRLTHRQVAVEVDFIEKGLGIQRGGVVLDLGCGSGQHAVELASRGYNVVGYDLSLTMLAMAADEAQERGQKINFLQGDMREMAFEEMFDGVFSWGTSFGFFDEEKNISVIQRVHRALRKGGLFLLDVYNRDFICARLPSLAWFEGDGCVCIDDAQFNAITSRLRVKRTIMVEDGTSREVEYTVRLYSLHEIGRILHEAGFKVVEVSGHPATSGAFFDAESPRLITLAVRR